MNYDMVIVGGGPAGSTLARLLAPRLQVLLLEQRNMSEPYVAGDHRKACGGLLSPHAQTELARLGLSLPENVIESPQPFAVRAIDLDAKIDRIYQRFYTNINREAFDRWLWDIVPDTVTKIDRAQFLDYDSTGGTVTYLHNGLKFSVTTQYLTGADGATSSVRKYVNLPVPRADRYIAIQTWHETHEPIPYYGAYFSECVTDFYGWSIPKREGELIGIAVRPGPQAWNLFRMFQAQLKDYNIGTGKQIRQEGALIIRPNHAGAVSGGYKNIFLIGEAGGWISPSSAEGFSYAFRTARYLARTFEDASTPSAEFYSQIAWKAHFNIFLRRYRSPILFNPIFRRPIMRCKIGTLH